jgi:hypothetical protein
MKVHHWYVCGCGALVLVISVLFTLLPVTAPAGQLADPAQRQSQQAPASSSSESAQDERFAYLPDQLANQAKEPAELPRTN